jgi:hypothetical protein
MRGLSLPRGRRLAGLILLAACGCSGKTASYTDTVEGVVTIDEVPLPGVSVQFMPDLGADVKATPSSATTDEKGHYRLTRNDNSNPGAAIGKHRVVIFPGRPAGAVDREDDKADPKAKARPAAAGVTVPGVYMAAAQTPLVIEVKADQKTYDLKLSRNPGRAP